MIGETRDPIETAAWFVIEQPGWVEGVMREHVRRDNGDCAGCGTYRPERWPCVLIAMARRAEELSPPGFAHTFEQSPSVFPRARGRPGYPA